MGVQSYTNNYINQHKNNTFERYLSELRLDKVSNILNIYKPKCVLDIGIGVYPIYLKYRDYAIYSGIDQSRELCTISFKKLLEKKYYSKHKITSIVCGDCETNLEVACRYSTVYDFIVLNSILHFIKYPKLFLENLKKYMSKKSIIYINVPNSRSLHRNLGLKMGTIQDIYELSEMDIKFGQINRFCLYTLQELVESCGFKILFDGTFCMKPFSEDQMNVIINDKLFCGLDSLSNLFPSYGCEIYMGITK